MQYLNHVVYFQLLLQPLQLLYLEALWVPTVTISLYKSSTKSAILAVDPEVIFLIFETVCFLSPGLILSGL